MEIMQPGRRVVLRAANQNKSIACGNRTLILMSPPYEHIICNCTRNGKWLDKPKQPCYNNPDNLITHCVAEGASGSFC